MARSDRNFKNTHFLKKGLGMRVVNVVIVVALVVVSGCTASFNVHIPGLNVDAHQAPSTFPRHTFTDTAFGGLDVVEMTSGVFVEGKSQFIVRHNNANFYFTNAVNMAKFVEEKEALLRVFGLNGFAPDQLPALKAGTLSKASMAVWNGQLLFFSSAVHAKAFEALAAEEKKQQVDAWRVLFNRAIPGQAPK